jgi:hypothetical protein
MDIGGKLSPAPEGVAGILGKSESEFFGEILFIVVSYCAHCIGKIKTFFNIPFT